MLIQFFESLSTSSGSPIPNPMPTPTPTPTPTPAPAPSPTPTVVPASAGLNFVDPGAASIVMVPGTTPCTSPAQIAIVQGAAEDLCLQCRYRGGATAAFAAGDSISAAIYQWRVATPVCTPEVAWYTASNSQTGYDQGQILVSLTNDQAALLQPTGGPLGYSLVVTWTPAALPSKSAPIVLLPLTVETQY